MLTATLLLSPLVNRGKNPVTSPHRGSQARVLSLDELADLEGQRRHLLASINDLDAEHAAGDIDDDDYHNLSDDYTRRTAAVLRAIDQGKATIRVSAPQRPLGQRLAIVVGVLVVAGLVGLLLARSAGFRTSNETATGDVRASTRTLLIEANELASQGQSAEAIDRYDQVLEIQPSNAEALTYKGWELYRNDVSAEIEPAVEALFDDAVRSDPTFSDVRVFRAVLFVGQERFEDAAEELRAFDETDPPPFMEQILAQFGLRQRVLVEQLRMNPPGDDFTAEQLGVTVDVLALAGRLLLDQGQAELAIKIFTNVIAEEPDNLTALMGRGELLVSAGVQTGDPELVESGIASLLDAVEVAPGSPDAGFLLAQAYASQGEDGKALAELDRLLTLDLTDDIRDFIVQLRSALEES
jgi:cytochrome c-type biogenesis protein CcmH/NrfG